MAKGAHLTLEVKKLIAQIYLEHPDYGPTKIREKLLKRMKETGLDQIFGPNWPKISTVGKVITEIRKTDDARLTESKAVDRPWRVLDIAQYPIPPETLPVVLEAWARELLEDNPLTIREVLWIARLYCVSKDRKDEVVPAVPDGEEPLDDIGTATRSAKAYAMDEIIYEFIGKQPDKPEDMWGDWFHDSGLYEMKMGEGEIGEKTRKEFRKRPHLIPHFTEEEIEKRTYRGGTQ